MSKLRSTLPLFLVVMFFSFAYTFEASFAFKKFMNMDFYISANSLPNTLLNIINHYYLIAYAILLYYLRNNKSEMNECRNSSFKDLSDKASEFSVTYFLLTLLSFGVFYIKWSSYESYNNILLIPSLYFAYVLYSHNLITMAIKSSIKSKFIGIVNTVEGKFNFTEFTKQVVIGTLFVVLFTASITTGLWAGLMAKNIAYIGDKSLTLSAPTCPVGILKIGVCKFSKQSIMKSGNLIALSDYYQNYPPESHSQAYSELSYTLNNANKLFSDVQWTTNQSPNNNYNVFKGVHNEHLEYNLMTVEMYKKSIINGSADQFVKNQKEKETKSSLKLLFLQM
jgi:hypothetical protein